MRHIVLMALLFGMASLPTAYSSTFVYCSEGSPSAFNPQITTDGTSSNAATYTIYNRLVAFKYGTTEIVPSLAQSWNISDDQLTYTFKLRKDVPFHKTKYFTPSRTLNADDVIYSFGRMRNKEHPLHKLGTVTFDYWNGMNMGGIIKDIKKIDDYTISFTLNKPEAPFLANLAMGFMSVLSKEYAEQLIKKNTPEKIDHWPVGTGPFIFRKYVKDSLIRFKANKKYFEGAPKIKKLVYSIVTDPSVRYQKLKAGECHLIIEPSPADLDSIKKQASIKLMSGSGLNVGYLAMNTQKKPFNNVLVRKAIRHALNKDGYIKAIYHGHASKAKNPLPPSIWGYNKAIHDYDYDVKKAKALLKKAGYPNGFKANLWTLPVSRPYNPNGKKMGEMMQADLKKIGIDITLVSYEWGTYLKKSRGSEHDLIQLGWSGDNGDPDNFLNVLLGCDGVKAGSNVARWCEPSFEKLVQTAKSVSTQKRREQLYYQAQKIFKEKSPWVPVAHSTIFRAMSNKVKGYKIDPLGHDIFKTIELK
jgi:dipeptide transport system substrate-binding protein